jgi:hypothetical protein
MYGFREAMFLFIMPEVVFSQTSIFRVVEYVSNCAGVKLGSACRSCTGVVQGSRNRMKGKPLARIVTISFTIRAAPASTNSPPFRSR